MHYILREREKGNYQEDSQLKKRTGIISIIFFAALLSPLALAAADLKIAYVNVTEIYNKSVFVEKANKTLQEHVKDMEAQLQRERKKLQSLINDFEKATVKSKKDALAKKITSGQSNLTSMTQQFQKKIQEQQNAGMQSFTDLVQTAVKKIVKDQHINVVVNSTSIVYTDSSWIDITKDVDAEMQQK